MLPEPFEYLHYLPRPISVVAMEVHDIEAARGASSMPSYVWHRLCLASAVVIALLIELLRGVTALG
jgi:hypothetical protein